LLLAVSLVATGLAAVQAYRTFATQREVVRSVVRGYAHSASWSYQQHLHVALERMAGEVLGAVHMGGGIHRNPPVPPAQEVADYFPWDPSCYCHRPRDGPLPRTIFAFDLDSDTIAVAVNHYRGEQAGWLTTPDTARPYVTPEASTAAVRWVNDTIRQRHHRTRSANAAFHYLFPTHAGRRHYLAYTLMPTAWGDTVVYGVEYTPEQFAGVLAQVFSEERHLPPVLQADLPTRELLAVQVHTPDGEALLRTRERVSWEMSAEDTLPASFDALRVRTAVLPLHAERFLIGGRPAARMPFLMLLLLLSGSLAVVALTQMRHEVGLAQARADFVSSVSHELRTPLAQIRLYLETLRLGRASDDATRAWSLDHIDRETQRLTQLVENVLLFSRGATSSMVGPTETRAVGDVVREIVTEFEPLARSRRMRIDVVVESDATAALKPGALRHALLNLLDNAAKYGPAGQTIRVHVRADRSVARITVSDEGEGVPVGERERVWTAFQRGTGAAARAAGGSGIGLTIVRELVQSLGGRAWVDNAPGTGAAFHVELPLTAAAATSASGSVPAPSLS
jgi:signal transduction histidine kinase